MKTRRRGVASIAAAVLVGAALAPAAAQADVPDDGIAFTRRMETGGADVFVTRPDGTGTVHVPLSYPVEDFGLPVWSPDGTRLLVSHVLRFDGNGELLPFRPIIVRPDGSGETLLEIVDGPFDMFCATWASNDRLLCAFGGDADGVYTVRASDDGRVTRLWGNAPGQRDLPFDLSPDGTRFAFIRFRFGPAPDPQEFRTQQVGLFVANIDGTGIRQVVPFGVAQGHELAAAHWSPDGRSIISSTTQGRLFVVPVDRPRMEPIKLDVGTTRYFAFEPDWSPDGSKIVFAMFVDGHEDIYTANRDGSNVTQITDTPEFENGPDWGPDLP
ncbi:MAG: PD40 domain-containing protein [Chloroflexi bacterium]|nr:PD40 domain-containing protein [Chloroflexota bacterium]